MTNTTQLLANLNALRVDLGMPVLKSWKESRAKLEDALAKAQAKYDALAAEVLKPATVGPKRTAAARPNPQQVSRKTVDGKKTPTFRDGPKSTDRKTEFANWCREQGVNPKVARAKLRKANHAKTGTRYVLDDAAKALVKGKKG